MGSGQGKVLVVDARPERYGRLSDRLSKIRLELDCVATLAEFERAVERSDYEVIVIDQALVEGGSLPHGVTSCGARLVCLQEPDAKPARLPWARDCVLRPLDAEKVCAQLFALRGPGEALPGDSRPRVIIVDDDPVTLRYAEQELSRSCSVVTTVSL